MLGSFNSTASGHLGPLGDSQQSCKVVGGEWKMFTKSFKICFWKTMYVVEGCLKWMIMRDNLIDFCLFTTIDDQPQRVDNLIELILHLC